MNHAGAGFLCIAAMVAMVRASIQPSATCTIIHLQKAPNIPWLLRTILATQLSRDGRTTLKAPAKELQESILREQAASASTGVVRHTDMCVGVFSCLYVSCRGRILRLVWMPPHSLHQPRTY